MAIFTVDRHGRPGMPTFNIKKVRRLLKEGRAEVFRRRPFTVRLLYAESLSVHPEDPCKRRVCDGELPAGAPLPGAGVPEAAAQ